MKSSKSKQKLERKKAAGDQNQQVKTGLHAFEAWLDQNLETMLRENAEWQTVTGNVQHFGRQPRKT